MPEKSDYEFIYSSGEVRPKMLEIGIACGLNLEIAKTLGSLVAEVYSLGKQKMLADILAHSMPLSDEQIAALIPDSLEGI